MYKIVMILIIITIVCFNTFLFSLVRYFINKSRNVKSEINDKLVQSKLDSKYSIESIESFMKVSEHLMNYIDSIIELEVSKIVLRSARLGLRYDVSNTKKDSEAIYEIVIAHFSEDMLYHIDNTFDRSWFNNYILSNSFSLLIKSTDDYNSQIK